jgi:hypothetical protein
MADGIATMGVCVKEEIISQKTEGQRETQGLKLLL